mmetsp:Transcript_16729/g.28426  ORF Transcript_16729/g.28426 Transcript_16729/m.28426 type:complete len:125 (+) Transcript_16729:263-637(+)
MGYLMEEEARQIKPSFSKGDIEQLFDPVIMKQLAEKKQSKDDKESENEASRYRNTKVTKGGLMKQQVMDAQHVILDQKLREKMEAESHKYDFKVIQRKLKGSEAEDGVYLKPKEIQRYLRLPQV